MYNKHKKQKKQEGLKFQVLIMVALMFVRHKKKE